MGPIDKLKSIGIIVLLVFTLITGTSTVYLIKANTKLHTELGVMQLKLDESVSTIKTYEDSARVDNEALEEQIESGIILENEFTSLDQQLADIKCKSDKQAETPTNVKKTIQQKQVSPPQAEVIATTVAIASVGRLLDTAACNANGDCNATKGTAK